jgi:hypothetical protein
MIGYAASAILYLPLRNAVWPKVAIENQRVAAVLPKR